MAASATLTVNGRVRSVSDPKGKSITSVEGLASDDNLHPLQAAFLEEDALQCGYCTSGMIMSGVALLTRHPSPTRAQIVHAMEGNICRCGTYTRIISAVERAAAIGLERPNG